MPDLLNFDGWAFSWYSHECQGITTLNPKIDTLPYSMDFDSVREFIYDEWATYYFQFKVITYDKKIRPFIKAEMKKPDNNHIFLNDSVEEFANPREPYVEFQKLERSDCYSAKLFWPTKPSAHYPGHYEIKIQLGWRHSTQSGIEPTWLPTTLPLIQIEIVDRIQKN